MSHFSQIKTKILDLNALEAALSELGIDSERGEMQVRGYRGNTQAASLIVHQDNGYDIGFQWNGDAYQLVADLQYWKQPWSVETFIDKVTQRYAYQTIVGESSRKGFQLVEQKQAEDGSVRLVLQRWGA
ncbi:DUF1257 domain-containing protein [Synechococcus sp. PCC 7336]|uniref:DUF1257 domain-containing protein n=1 Tax=Synechococcus sp. PCC 7336 TaxID=195250 RepID=UPI00034A7695|nr:DUF1257 domain-containing protein [Synechococcus sp. PCC 7336]